MKKFSFVDAVLIVAIFLVVGRFVLYLIRHLQGPN